MEYKYVNGNSMKTNADNLLDQYFTKRDVSMRLYLKAIEVIQRYESDLSEYIWLEPSVGEGCFFDILPTDKRIGIDLEPQNDEVIKHDYLTYSLPNNKLIVIGNPPFGHRGVLALEFINHSSSAEYVAFVLPMFFKSMGKGSIRYRVKGFNLIYEENLPHNSFYLANGKDADVKCCFQIWSKNHSLEKQEFSWYSNNKSEPFGEYVKVVTVSLAKKRECGKKWIFEEKPNWYLSSTFYKETHVVTSFDEVNYKSGIAIIYTTQDPYMINKLNDIFTNVDWTKYASLATNGCYHIGKSHLFQLLKDKLGGKIMDVNDIMEKVINDKYEELNSQQNLTDRFIKIRSFEANAIGQVGETFVKKVFKENDIPMLDLGRDVVHDEYDIISNDKKIEIKTARKGLKNDSFQFNGINPRYNHDYIILIGLTTDKLYYKIIDGKCRYDHATRKNFVTVNGRQKQIVAMNPGNSVNYKLTLSLKDLDDISSFVKELKSLFVN